MAAVPEQTKDGLLVPVGDYLLKLEVCQPDIIRVAAARDRAFFDRHSIVTAPRPRGGSTPFTVSSAGGASLIDTGSLRVRVDHATGAVSFLDTDGRTILEETPGTRLLAADTTPGSGGARAVGQRWKAQEESLYGLGQQQYGRLGIKGLDLDLWQHNTNVVVPFLVSSRGYGLLWDQLSFTRFGDLRENTPIPASVLVDADGKPGALTASYYADAHFSQLVARERATRIDVASRNTGTNLNKIAHPALPEGDVSVRWEGDIVPSESGVYHFRSYSDGGIRLYVDGKLLVDHWRQDWLPSNDDAGVELKAGQRHHFRLDWVKDQKATTMNLGWKTPAPTQDTALWSEAADGLDYYFVKGPSLDKVVAGYRALTGQATMIPKWAFGLWQSRQRYKTADEITGVLEGFRSRRIPIDVIVEDWFYWKDGDWGSHEFDAARFPDPEGLLSDVHNKYNARLMISVWGKFYTTTKNYMELSRIGCMYKPNLESKITDWLGYNYSFYDAFSAEGRKLYWDQINRQLFSKGVDAWWLDATEPDLLPIPSVDGHRTYTNPTAEGPGARVLNGYALHTSMGVYEGQRQAAPDQRVYILTRSGFAGQQRFAAATWSGDTSSTWTAMSRQIQAGLGFSLSGVPYWTMDIGGFSVPARFNAEHPKPEDLEEWREMNTRWFQFGTFAPIFRVHGESPFREMWEFGGESHPAYAAQLRFDKLRYQLMPYIYALGGAVTQQDYTMMRPLAMDFQSDARSLATEDEFLFGPALLVSPVTVNKARERQVYLPPAKGGWYELWSGANLEGGREITAPAPYDSIPLHVRAGSIIPTGPEIQYTGEKPADPLTLWVYAGADGRFGLYEDDGLSYQYEKGAFSTIPLSWDEASSTLTIGERKGSFKGMLAERTFKVVLVRPGKPVAFTQDPAAQQTLHYSGAKLTVVVK